MTIKHDAAYYQSRKPVQDLGPIGNFKRFVWDSSRRAFFDRTAAEWRNVGIYYLCFFSVLFTFSGVQMYITYKYITAFDKPFFEFNRVAQRIWLDYPNRRSVFGLSSLNLHGPGIVLKPNVIPNAKPPMVMLDESKDYGKKKRYVDAIQEVLAEYKKDKSKYELDCNDSIFNDKYTNKSCFFDVSTLGSCSKPPFGYTEVGTPQPCVYIKFNKRFGWTPIFYSQASYLPEEIPNWLQKIIKTSEKFHVWLSCEGKTESDAERMGEIEYLPKPGFPVQYFPYSGQSDYLPPIVALRFKNLAVDELITIECKTWARNIDNENRHNLNFRVLIKTPKT